MERDVSALMSAANEALWNKEGLFTSTNEIANLAYSNSHPTTNPTASFLGPPPHPTFPLILP